MSLDTRVGRDMDTELGDLLEDGMPTPEQRLTREKLHDDLLGLLNELSGREARVIRLRFGLDDDTPQTLAEIGKTLDLSRERCVKSNRGRCQIAPARAPRPSATTWKTSIRSPTPPAIPPPHSHCSRHGPSRSTHRHRHPHQPAP